MSGCGCGAKGTKKYQYECVCEDDDCGCCNEDSCGCEVVEFDKEPAEVLSCCGKPMRRAD